MAIEEEFWNGCVVAASRVFDLLGSRDDTFARYLRPGLSDAEIARILLPTGIQAPAEAVAFYTHFSPTKGYQHSTDQPSQ